MNSHLNPFLQLSKRMSVDFRQLNKVTVHVFEGEPMPDSEISIKVNILRKQTFAKVTGNSHAKRRHSNRTPFVTPDGLFRFSVLPFDLSNVAITFNRMMRV